MYIRNYFTIQSFYISPVMYFQKIEWVSEDALVSAHRKHKTIERLIFQLKLVHISHAFPRNVNATYVPSFLPSYLWNTVV